jgi:serine/threonine protein kinase/uncharacterized coiled-coil DUF342 family protein
MQTQGLQINPVKERLIFLAPTVQERLERESCLADFEILGGLGSGAFGKVHKVRHKITKAVYALKQISKSQLKSQKMVPQIKNEIKIMYSLDQPNIIKLFSHFEENDYIYLIIEFAEGGQLWDKLVRKGRFDEKTVQQFMREMIAALEYCHSRSPPIIHRDIKPENILLDKEGHIKLADFGWSNFFNPGAQRKTYCGTLDYLAPEMIQESGHDTKVDIWSLGVLIFELLTGKAPFTPPSNIKDAKQMQSILEENILNVRIDYPKDFPPLAKDLVSKLLKKNPQTRISNKDMKDHAWLRGNAPKNQPAPSPPVSVSATANTGTSSNLGSMNNLPVSMPSTPKTPNAQGPNLFVAQPGHQHTDSKASPASKKKLDEDDVEDFSTDELKVYSSRKQSIIHKKGEETSPAPPQNNSAPKANGAEKLFERFSISANAKQDDGKQKVIEDLNDTVKRLRNDMGELEVNLKMKNTEIGSLKRELEKYKAESSNFTTDASGKPLPIDAKKFKLMEDEKLKLKKEIDDIWKALEEKENTIQNQNHEIKRLSEFKKQAEKLKADKTLLNDEIKKLASNLNQLNASLNECRVEKEEDKLKYEKLLKDLEVRNQEKQSSVNNQVLWNNFVQEMRNQMEQMSKKLDFYKEKSETLDAVKMKLAEKEKECLRLKTEHGSEMNDLRKTLSEEYEEKIEKWENRYNNDIKALNDKHSNEMRAFDERLREIQTHAKGPDLNNLTINTLKLQKDISDKAAAELRAQASDMQKIISENKITVSELRAQIEDLKMRMELQKKTYKKS